MTTTVSTTARKAGRKPRQYFRGGDDLLLLVRVDRAAPWTRRGAVMDAWEAIAREMNADRACTLTTLTAASCRARFFRLVAQRQREEQSGAFVVTALVETDSDALRKRELVDDLIKRVDAFQADERGGLLETAPTNASVAAAVSHVAVPESADQSVCPSSRNIADEGASMARLHTIPEEETNSSQPCGASDKRNDLQQQWSWQRNDHIVRRDQTAATKSAPAPPLAPAPRSAASYSCVSTASHVVDGTDGIATPPAWVRTIAERAVTLFEKKLEIDRSAVEHERERHREEARQRAEEFTAQREHMQQMLTILTGLMQNQSREHQDQNWPWSLPGGATGRD